MLNKKAIAAVALVSLLSGCASPARVDQMAARPSASAISTNGALKGQVAVKEVKGGSETNPLWTSQIASGDFEKALEKSLESAGLIAPREGGRFHVIANMAKVDQPLMGLDMTVTAHVRYVVVERASGRTVFDKTIAVPFTATMSDAFIGTERLKIANEGAARVNIGKFIDELVAMQLTDLALK